MIQQTLVVGPLQCNCVLLGCERTKEAVVIDPGDEGPRILTEIQKAGFSIKYILHTHAHFDHIGATKHLKESLTAPPCLHKADLELYQKLPSQGRYFGMQFDAAPAIEKFIEDNEILSFGDHRLEVFHTPGHSPGSVCFRLMDGEGSVYSGDTLFQLSIGRSDFWGGDHDTLIRSIKSRLLTLDDEISVHPGHGPSTTIGLEKRRNPFLV